VLGRPLGLDYGLRLPGTEIRPASGEAHKRRCLEALAPVLSLRDRLHQLPRDARDTLFLLAVIAWVLRRRSPHLPLWCSLLARRAGLARHAGLDAARCPRAGGCWACWC
jgi:uncharacterized protein (DUF58 family)